jgi:hypothetical protein
MDALSGNNYFHGLTMNGKLKAMILIRRAAVDAGPSLRFEARPGGLVF